MCTITFYNNDLSSLIYWPPSGNEKFLLKLDVTSRTFINCVKNGEEACFRKVCSSHRDRSVARAERRHIVELRRSSSYSKSSRRTFTASGNDFHSRAPSSLWFSYRVKHTRSTGHVTRNRVGHKILIMTGRNSFSHMQGCIRRDICEVSAKYGSNRV